MYRYDEFDAQLVKERVTQFRGQVQRRLAGQLTDEQFKPLRLMNGLYLQLHAYMLRIAIPYGTLSSRQLRMLAHIARKYDKGYGHFTTRQNIQFNWPALVDVPEILEDLASVEMHCMQTSGNCIRNVTSDQYAGVAREEIEDPRPWCEVIRQWSTLHPEFSYLPRKFKIAVTGCAQDRAAIRVHDIGIAIVRNETQEIGFQIFVGGGQGRTPMIAVKVRDFLPQEDLLPYLEAIMRVYNRYGRRDNLHKARVKILVHALGEEETRRQVEEEFAALPKATIALPQAESERIRAYFAPPPYETLEDEVPQVESLRQDNPEFKAWWENNTAPHKIPGYVIVNISLKPIEGVAGDADAQQMDAIADMADTFSHGEVRVTHEQNLTLPFVRKTDTPLLWKELQAQGLATPNIALITDQIVCPGLDYCNLANARSISVAQRLSDRFRTQTRQQEIGELKIKISGCMNACGHHHVGHIGILGVDKKGQEYYQLLLGGSADENAALGKITGAAFTEEEIVDAVERVVEVYLEHRRPDEKFLDTYNRLGLQPFKDSLYASA